MGRISDNLKYLRKKKGLTQQQFADVMEIKRSLVGAYEEDRAEPKYDLLKKIAEYFEISIDDFINEKINDKWSPKPKGDPSNLRVLSITLDNNDRENIEFVNVKASAGYLNGYGDPEYVAELPKFSLPMFNQGTYRAFEIKGDSMLPLPSGSIIIAEYVENWNNLKIGDTAVIVSKNDGVVYKRIASKFKPEKGIKLSSDNQVYEPYTIVTEDILEIWQAKAFISTELPQPTPEPTMESLTSMMAQMQKSIVQLQQGK
ncbi:helix-turn-helix domain protein [Pseudopedobacter saltans DSM 12145]|uniref:Helix-turn-helix domain protein n=1 Tax=Pseudopedobacter saltans (strain ATCC 51119 / DSM 12145 / JCM 21818 / CCUG 39354 / LMG 10337 / NBRC 100064 / NCIMB 13643) TaxID=762903 RepID=F0SD17_PSESL|nr:LexA family transcriptional regulator [Pseudopedobacter saltans]ADY51774.1 helix-turn-helix domain protein [Pseudopedobacter saltans DSM 12145]